MERRPEEQEPAETVLLAEYAAAQESYLHHSSLRWEIGGLLEAGVFVFWGFLLEMKHGRPQVWAVASFMILALMSVWLIYSYELRSVYLVKIDRIREIERHLSMEQNRRFIKGELTRKSFADPWPRASRLNDLIFTLAVLGAPALGAVASGWTRWYLPTVAGWALVCVYVWVLDRRVRQQLDL